MAWQGAGSPEIVNFVNRFSRPLRFEKVGFPPFPAHAGRKNFADFAAGVNFAPGPSIRLAGGFRCAYS